MIGMLILILVIPIVSSDQQHLLIENVTYVPRTQDEFKEETKGLRCDDSMHNITYVLNPNSFGTSIGCFSKTPVLKYCLEYNFKNGEVIIQPKLNAPCHDLSITPCEFKYFSPESYKFFECFEKYGGISSPKENQRKINSSKQRELSLNTEIQEVKKMLEQIKFNLTNQNQELKKEIQEQNETINQRDDKIQSLQDHLKIYKGLAISFIAAFIILLFSLIPVGFILFHFRNRKIQGIDISKESQHAINDSSTMPSTDRVDPAAVCLIKYSDKQKQERFDEDQSEVESAVQIIPIPNNVDQPDDTCEIHVGKPLEEDLKMNKRRDKDSVEYPVGM